MSCAWRGGGGGRGGGGEERQGGTGRGEARGYKEGDRRSVGPVPWYPLCPAPHKTDRCAHRPPSHTLRRQACPQAQGTDLGPHDAGLPVHSHAQLLVLKGHSKQGVTLKVLLGHLHHLGVSSGSERSMHTKHTTPRILIVQCTCPVQCSQTGLDKGGGV